MLEGLIIHAQDLKVSYGPFLALQISDLTITANAGVIGFFGPNGAGKSTLLRSIIGDITHYEGASKIRVLASMMSEV